MRIKRKHIISLLFGFLLVFSFRILLRTPVEPMVYLVEAGLLVFFLLFIAFYTYLKVESKTLSSAAALILFMMFMPLYSGLSAYFEFGQPILYGILAQRDFYLTICGLFLLFLLQQNWLNIRDVERVFVGLSWACLIFFLITVMVVDPKAYVETGFVGYNELKGGYVFRFNMTFIIFGGLYYGISYVQKKRVSDLLFASFFLLYILLLRQDRTIVLTTFFALVSYSILNLRFGSLIKNTLVGLAALSFFLIYFNQSDVTVFQRTQQLYSSALEIFSGGKGEDGSANARIAEAQKAFVYVSKNPWLGNGELSKRWRNGFERVMGKFYPSDIGLLGVIFVFGVFGSVILYLQSLFAAYFSFYPSPAQGEHFYTVCKYFLLAYYANSLTDGGVLFKAAVSVVFVVILYWYYYLGKRELLRQRMAVELVKEPVNQAM